MIGRLTLAFVACGFSTGAIAQTSPNLTYGQVPTAGQWNGWFAGKQDLLPYKPLNLAGGSMTGKLTTAPSTINNAGFSILPGTAPAAPVNGDLWIASGGLYARINNQTLTINTGSGYIQGPLTGDVTTSGSGSTTTLAASGVAAGVYGSSTTVPVLTVDAKGRVTAATTASAAGTGTVTNIQTGAGLAGGPVTTTGTITAADSLMQGRLSLTPATPVMASVVLNAAYIFYTPYTGNLIGLWNGSTFVEYAFSEYSQALSDTTYSPAAAVAGACYDDFAWNSAGTVRATRGPSWSAGAVAGSNTARGTGAGSTSLTRVNGVLVNAVAITNGPAAGFGTYLGTFCTDAGGATVSFSPGSSAAGGGQAILNIWNAYNRVPIIANVADSASTWTYQASAIRAAHGSSTFNVTMVKGLPDDTNVQAVYSTLIAIGSGTAGVLYVGLDSQTVAAPRGTWGYSSTLTSSQTATYNGPVGLGQHYVQALESANTTAAATFYGVGIGALTVFTNN